MEQQDPFSQSGLFARALRGILRPLVRALIAQNVTATALYRIVKQTYVEVAEDMLGKDTTDSRLSVMTGVHRRDVKEFRQLADSATDQQQRKVSTLSTVVGRWMSHADYTDAEGLPIPVPRTAENGPSFEALVQSVSRDIRPRTVLDELVRQEIIKNDGDNLELVLDGLLGPADIDQRLHFFSHNLGDHMNAAVDNLLSEVPPHLERAVFYNNLDAGSLRKIEENARSAAIEVLRQINAEAAKLQNPDATDMNAKHRFRFGVFFYQEKEGSGTKGGAPDDDL